MVECMPVHALTCSVYSDSSVMLTVLSGNVDGSCGQGTRSLQWRQERRGGADRSFCSVYSDRVAVHKIEIVATLSGGRLID